jgi:hypothetical protein
MKHFDYETIRERVVDAFGRKTVLSLFTEFGRKEFVPIWSLHKDWRPIFLETADPTEYETAMRLIGDWDHYQAIRNHAKLKPIFDKWAREVEVKLRSQSIMKMVRHSSAPNGAAAAKWLAEGAFMGRVLKNKQEKQEEEQVRDEIGERVSADMERLGIRVVAGGKS